MFTGIVQTIGTVSKAEHSDKTFLVEIGAGVSISKGSSVSVSGVCLTADSITDVGFTATLMPETQNKTTLGDLKKGDTVNVEPSLRLGDELGGHFVFGHVDAVGEISKVKSQTNATILTIHIPDGLADLIVGKGSVTLDGVSLTVVDVSKGKFTVSLVPFTLKHTTLGMKKIGDMVNIEADMLARYAQAHKL